MGAVNDRPLAGCTVGVTAQRRREELGDALARQGADVVYGQAIRVVPLVDDTQLREATAGLVDVRPDVVVATTAVGFRGWLEAAASWGLGDALREALDAADVLTRGPKVRGAVRAAGLREVWSPESESSDEVFAHLAAEYDLTGLRVAVQLHGDPLTGLLDRTRAGGADVVPVPVYRWEPPADPAPLHELIRRVAQRRVDAVTFTSAPASANFVATASALGLGDDVRAAFVADAVCFAVGSVTAGPLVADGIAVVWPERFRLGALVREVATVLPARRAATNR